MARAAFFIVVVGFATTLALIRSSAATDSDQKCTISQIASFDLGAGTDGVPTVPVTISGHPYIFEINPSASISWVSPHLVNALNLPVNQLPSFVRINGKESPSQAIVRDLSIGSLHGDRFTFAEAAPDADDQMDGLIGLDILEQFDIDLDLRANKLNLFSRDHCPGKVV